MVPTESAIYITSIVRSYYKEEQVNPLVGAWPKETAAERDVSSRRFARGYLVLVIRCIVWRCRLPPTEALISSGEDLGEGAWFGLMRHLFAPAGENG